MKPKCKSVLPKIGREYLHNRAYRLEAGIYIGAAVNLVYAVFRAIAGILLSSVWMISTAAYFSVLGLMRVTLAVSRKRAVKGGTRFAVALRRRIGLWLLLLNLPLGGMIVLLIKTDIGNSYPGYMIYASAAYTFYMLTTAIINVVKRRGSQNSVLRTAGLLNFAAALVSVLGLQNALIGEFSQSGAEYRVLMNTLTGIGVYAAVIALAAFMLFGKGTEENEQIGK